MALLPRSPTLRRSALRKFGRNRHFRPLESRSPAASGSGARRTQVETSTCSSSPPPTSTSIMIEEVAAVKVFEIERDERFAPVRVDVSIDRRYVRGACAHDPNNVEGKEACD